MTHHHGRLGTVLGTAALLLALEAAPAHAAPAGKELVYVGSGRQNISAFWLDLDSGTLDPVGEVAQTKAPSFITFSPNGKVLYAIAEGANAAESAVKAYAVDAATAKLTLINSQPTGGAGPCFVFVDPKDKAALVANYASGSVAAFPIGADGALGASSAFIQDQGSSVNPDRQEGPHAHCIITDPDDRFAFACDLGLDKVMIFKIDGAKGTLVANDPPFAPVKAGSGPRHIAFSPDRRFAYVVNEMGSTVTAFAYDRRRGALREIGNYPLLPDDYQGKSWAAEIAVDRPGKFVYASNRGDDSIVVFKRDHKTGLLSFMERDSTLGKTPRNFAIDPTGAYLLAADQGSGTIQVFRIDNATGRLRPTGGKGESDTPMCVAILSVEK